MAEIDFDSSYDPDERGGIEAAANALNWLAAVLSLGLMVGLAAWGWNLLKRDVTGVPVVQALEGPMRITPEAPGGREAAHQGLAVNRIAAVGEADIEPEKVVLAPSTQELAEEDAPLQALLEQASAPEPQQPLAEPQSATDLAVAAALAEIEATIEPALLSTDAVDEAPKQQVSVSLMAPRPQPRPLRLAMASDASLSLVPSLDVTEAQVETGARLVQLGAFISPDVAKEEWDRLNANFDGYLEGKQRLIQKAEAGGKTFYRLRVVGFEDLGDANRFCSVLAAGNASCIPIVNR